MRHIKKSDSNVGNWFKWNKKGPTVKEELIAETIQGALDIIRSPEKYAEFREHLKEASPVLSKILDDFDAKAAEHKAKFTPEELKDDGTTICDPSKTWICGACGKKSKTKYGMDKTGQIVSDPWWDESCMMNSFLIDISKL